MEQERRKHTRVSVKFNVLIAVGEQKIPVHTWDLSLRGMQCTAHSAFREGLECTVIFVLSSDVRFHIQAVITRLKGKEAGIYFTSMDEDSFYHLKRVVQYNADNADTIDTEIAPRARKS